MNYLLVLVFFGLVTSHFSFALAFLFLGNLKILTNFINMFRNENPQNISDWIAHIIYVCLFSLPYLSYKALEKRYSFWITKLFYCIGFFISFLLLFGVLMPIAESFGLLRFMENI
ncbi:hypothetical protein J2S05_003111 [Alkalicoccobacillus murimartini]|uniref:Uncharacterized protein n=1 Tax=Alkalicoccobacillus murimartini TaxID=171685 RepID=A0ABT9YKB6_9BACI|nr:hypothetical protein [Alkalicoccobacillus murimartini]